MADTISSLRRSVCRTPVMKLPSGKTRFPACEMISTSASSARSGGTPSAAGEALQMFPATVPRF